LVVEALLASDNGRAAFSSSTAEPLDNDGGGGISRIKNGSEGAPNGLE